MPPDPKRYAHRLEGRPLGFFETPILCGKLSGADAMVRDLKAVILEHMAKTPGLDRSNIGGWHSDTDMLTWGGDAARTLAETAVTVAKRLSHFQERSPDDYGWFVRMWANVTSKGGLNHMHAHPGNLWAAVFYVDAGRGEQSEQDVGGRFYVEDPRFPMNAMRLTAMRTRGGDGQPQVYQPEFSVEEGGLIVFPAWLRHGVRPYNGDGQRISVAMNIDARQLPSR